MFGSVARLGAVFEGKVFGQHLLHEQGRGDCFEHVVHGHGHFVLGVVGLGDEVGELGVGFAFAVAGDAPDDLDDFGE